MHLTVASPPRENLLLARQLSATLTLLVILFGQVFSAHAKDNQDQRPPNVLLILADDVGRDVLGCYGGTSYKTPKLDALAAGGIRFRHGYVMPVCHPTRVCLLTGRYPSSLRNPRWGSFPKSAEQQTLPHALRKAGYATAIAGKWQLTLLKRDPEHPHRLGFDEYALFGWHEGPRYFEPLIWQNGKIRDDVEDRYGPDVYTEFLIDFMKANRDGPFFAFYSMALCHDVTDDLKSPPPLGPQGRYETYREMAESMDRQVGKLVEALDELGLRKNTLILFLTDNGTPKSYIATAKDGKLIRKSFTSEYKGEPIRGGKGSLDDRGTRVPWIANWKGNIEPGQVVDDLVDVSDLLPTLADIAGAPLPKGVELDGASFAARLRATGAGPREWVHAEHRGRRFVRNRRYKLYASGRFYNVKQDPREKHPLGEDLSQEAAKAKRRLEQALKQVQDAAS